MKYLLPFALMFTFAAEANCNLNRPVRLDMEKLKSEGELVFNNVQTEKGPGKLSLIQVGEVVAARLETPDGKVWGPRLEGKYDAVVEEALYLVKELYTLSDGEIVHTVKNVFDYVKRDNTLGSSDYYKTFVWIKGDVLSSVNFEDREDIVYPHGYRTWVIDPFCVEKI